MRAETIIILALIILVWRLATRTTGAGIVPPDDDEPRQQTPPEAPTLYEVDLSKTQGAIAS